MIDKIKIDIPKKIMQPRALPAYSIFRVFSMCTLAYVVD